MVVRGQMLFSFSKHPAGGKTPPLKHVHVSVCSTFSSSAASQLTSQSHIEEGTNPDAEAEHFFSSTQADKSRGQRQNTKERLKGFDKAHWGCVQQWANISVSKICSIERTLQMT